MEDSVEIAVQLDKETYDKLMKMSKKELIDKMANAALDAKIAKSNQKKAENELESYKTKLDKCETHCEQGRAMINAVMERWYEYDV